jgi:hypothetical protein
MEGWRRALRGGGGYGGVEEGMEVWRRAWSGGRRQGDAEGVGRDDIKETF